MGECALEARTVWLQTDERNRPIGAGICFVEVSDGDRNKLTSYLERFAELEAQITS
jgi:hypothetical protein